MGAKDDIDDLSSALLEAFDDALWLADVSGVLVRANGALAQLTGYGLEQLIGRAFTDLLAPGCREAALAAHRSALTGHAGTGALTLLARDGSALACPVVRRSRLRQAGRDWVLTRIARERRAPAGDATAEREKLLRQITESIHEVYWMFDLEKARTAYISPAYETLWGRSMDSLYRDPRSFAEAIHPEDRARVVAAQARQIHGDYSEDYRIIRPDGSVRWVRDQAYPVRNESGAVYRIAGVATDITEEKQAQREVEALNRDLEDRIAERTAELMRANQRLKNEITQRTRAEVALRESGERLRRMIATAHDAVVGMDAQGLIAEWNGQAERIFGWRRDEVLARPLADVLVPPRLRAAHERGHQRYLATGVGRILNTSQEMSALHKDGHEFPIELSIWPVKTGDADFFYSFIRDISERKRREEETRARTEQALIHRNVLLQLAQFDKQDFHASLQRILRAVAETLEVERVAWWGFSEDGAQGVGGLSYTRGSDSFAPPTVGLAFDAAHFPRYFEALRTQGPVVASRAMESPAVAEFVESYLRPFGITSLIDVGVWQQGRLIGCVCVSHIGPARDWTSEEVDFANAIGTIVALARETADRHALTAELSASEEKYRLVVENANEAILIAQDGYARFANAQAIAMTGLTPEQYFGRPFVEMIFPEDRARVVENHVRRMAGETIENNYDFRIVDGRGQLKWLQISAVKIDWNGRPATLNFLTDISERKALEENLRATLAELAASERKYRRVIDRTSEGFWLLDADRRTIEVNRALTTMLGYPGEEMLGRTPYEFADAENRRLLEGQVAAAGKTEHRTYELALRRKDGSLMPARLNVTVLRSVDGALEGSFAFVSDMTEVHRLQSQIARSLAEREVILATAAVGIGFVQFGLIRWVNSVLEQQMLGYAPGELIGVHSEQTFISHEAWKAFLGEAVPVIARGARYETEIPLRRKDGSTFWAIFTGRAIDHTDLDRGSIWSMIDITEQRQAREEIKRALAKERELSELKSRFVSMTSHEFRTPLATILSSAELLSDYGDRLLAGQRSELIGYIKTGVRTMTELLEDVLIIGRAEAGRLEFNPQPVDARALAASVLDEIRRGLAESAPRQSFDLALEASGETPPRPMDEKLMRHLLGNLLSNAIKYSPAGGRVRLALHCEPKATVFVVDDQGIGIPPEDQGRIFDTFHRARNVGNISGTGLGLAIVKNAVEAHGGTISLESEPGRGSRFTVRIPT